jgi:hypothetical protein
MVLGEQGKAKQGTSMVWDEEAEQGTDQEG